MDLSKNDYLNILKYYNLDSKLYDIQKLKQIAEELLATKLCKCIKKVDKHGNDESRAIAICKNSVLKKKNLKIYGFTCKKRAKFIPKKGSSKNLVKIKLVKTRRNRAK
jgi:hypothetical protein